MDEKVSLLQRFKNWLSSPPKRQYINEFYYFNRYNGGLELDVGKWIRSEEFKEQCRKMKEFEKICRANSKDGSFSFYD